ncbi:MAG: heparinase II/III family protein [Verrucomicrobiota bacterium]
MIITLAALNTTSAQDWTWTMSKIELPRTHPQIACTAEELARLKTAYASQGPDHDVVADVVTRAEQALAQPLNFPPSGGQHNQWYQCEPCQTGLVMVDDTHHKCPACGKIYTGTPYDDVIFGRQHHANLTNLNAAAWAYAITGRKEFADFAAKVLLGYAERYQKYPFHSNNLKQDKSGGHIFEQTLTEASALATEIGPAWDLVRDSAAFTPQDRQAVRAGLLLPMLQTIAGHNAGKTNWQTWHNAAFIWGGVGLDDETWIRRALENPANGFAFQMQASVTGDGMWYENSWGYHFYTLSALVAMAEGSRRLGIDIWSHPNLKKMFTLPAAYAMADGTLPRFGDDVGRRAFSQWNLNECAYRAYGDAALVPMLADKPIWESVLFGRKTDQRVSAPWRGSEILRSAGHAILRTRGEAGLSAAVTFGPYGGCHGRIDKLSFVLVGFGRELGVDPGRAASQAYRLPIHGNWYKATTSHNAVLVDGQSQQPAEGKLEFFEATDHYTAVTVACDAAYPGVKHRRMLCLTDSYLVVLDDLSADRERRFDWLYHNRGTGVRCEAAKQENAPPSAMMGLEYIKNLLTGKTNGPIKVQFDGGEVTTFLTLTGAPGTEIRIGDGVGASVADRVPLAMVTRRGKAVRFAAVIQPVTKTTSPVSDLTMDEISGCIRLVVSTPEKQDIITLAPSGKVVATTR